MGDPVGELIPGGRIRNPRGHGQHSAEELPAAVSPAEVKAHRCLIKQILQIRTRTTQFITILGRASRPNE